MDGNEILLLGLGIQSPWQLVDQRLDTDKTPHELYFTYLDGLMGWCTDRIGAIEVEHHVRQQCCSGYSIGKLLGFALNLYTHFSLIPLQVVSAVGFLTAASGFVVGFYYLVQYLLTNIVVPGFASTIIAFLILGGVQLLALGIMGEHLGRLHLNVNRNPQYVVRRACEPQARAAQDAVQ